MCKSILIKKKYNYTLLALLKIKKKKESINKKIVKFSDSNLLAYIASKGEKIVRINTICEHFKFNFAEILVAKRQVAIDISIWIIWTKKIL